MPAAAVAAAAKLQQFVAHAQSQIMPRRADSTILTLLLASCQVVPAPTPRATPGRVAAYRAAFAASAGTHFVGRLSRAQFLGRLAEVRVVWLGDHHRSPRLHALQRDLVVALAERERPLLLALEAIGDADEPTVAEYLAGRIDAELLRERLRARWPGSWLSDDDLDSGHYRALLVAARRHEIPVVALEPIPRLPLAQRDGVIAARVRQLVARHPDRLVVVILGQAHLAGAGAVVASAGVPSVVIGGEPTAPLVAAAPARGNDGDLLLSDGQILWFAELLRAPPESAAPETR